MTAPSRPRPDRRARAGALLAAAVLIAAPASIGAGRLYEAYAQRFLGKPAPPMVLKDMTGREVKLSDYRGKVVLLNFWYSACFPCRAETPDLVELYKAHKDRGLVVLGINTDPLVMPNDRGTMLRSFVDTFKIPYPILMADRKAYEDYGRVPIAPITLLVDRRGTIAQIFWGATRGQAFESALRPYLEARADGSPARPASAP